MEPLNRPRPGTAQDGQVRRTLSYLAAWFAAGVAAVLLAGAGLGMVGRQVTGSRPAPLSAEQVRDELAAAEAPSTTSSTATTVPTSSTTAPSTTSTTAPPTTDGGPAGSTTTTTTPVATPPPTTRSYDLVGGTVTVRFSPAGVTLVSATPKAGFSVEKGETHSNGIRVEFEGEDHKSRLDAWWDGGPQDEVREED
jgi:cytoskeletal protein RodZ